MVTCSSRNWKYIFFHLNTLSLGKKRPRREWATGFKRWCEKKGFVLKAPVLWCWDYGIEGRRRGHPIITVLGSSLPTVSRESGPQMYLEGKLWKYPDNSVNADKTKRKAWWKRYPVELKRKWPNQRSGSWWAQASKQNGLVSSPTSSTHWPSGTGKALTITTPQSPHPQNGSKESLYQPHIIIGRKTKR